MSTYGERGLFTFGIYLRHGICGIFLAALFICCLFVVQNIKLPVKEEAGAVYTNAPKPKIDASMLRPIDPASIFAEMAGRNLTSSEILILPEYKKEEWKLNESPDDIVYEVPVLPDPTLQKPGAASGIEPETVPKYHPQVSISFTGSLRMDYCVGSQNDLSGIRIYLEQNGITSEIPLEDCLSGNIDTSVPGDKVLSVTYGDSTVEIPYGVVLYKVEFKGNGGVLYQDEAYLYNYGLDMENIPVPRRSGKEFIGWYKDPECRLLFTGAAPGETVLPLYAGFQDFADFISDDAGNIISYTGGYESIIDGLLRLPDHMDCTGIASGAFVSLGAGISDVYIPGNITYISPDAFDTLTDLFYIEVAEDNQNYSSKQGMLYTKDGSELVICPKGRDEDTGTKETESYTP